MCLRYSGRERSKGAPSDSSHASHLPGGAMARKFTSLMVLAFLAVTWTSLSSAQESTYDVVKKRATLIAGVKNDYPPFGFVDGDGKWVGIEVDMSKYIADKLGVALKMEPVTSRTRIP